MTKITKLSKFFIFGFILFWLNLALADNALENINIELLSNGKIKLILKFCGPVKYPKSFSIDDPAQLVFDFPNTENKLTAAMQAQNPKSGVLKNFKIVTVPSKLRLIVNLTNIVPYTIKLQKNNILELTLSNIEHCGLAAAKPRCIPKYSKNNPANFETNRCISLGPEILNFDFKRGQDGEGVAIVKLSNSSIEAIAEDSPRKIKIRFYPPIIDKRLIKRYDVTEFGTVVRDITLQPTSDSVILEMQLQEDFEKTIYQIDNDYVLEVRRTLGADSRLSNSTKNTAFTGEKISLNFQDIDVRSILQLLADFTGLNIVAMDSISGQVTLRLHDVPWDQALDIILKSRNLDKRQDGNIILIGPRSEIEARERSELEASKFFEDLLPIHTELIRFNYASASDFAKNMSGSGASFLSSRGKLTVDDRTNTLLIQDIDSKIIAIKNLIEQLDIPIRQVQIEAQIVETTSNIEENFGIKLTGGLRFGIGGRKVGIGGGTFDATKGTFSPANTAGINAYNIASAATEPDQNPSVSRGLFFNGDNALANTVGRFGAAISSLPGGTLLELELQAMEFEGNTKVLSRPKVITLDKKLAYIEQGQEIPVTSISQNGTNVEFKNAVTRLEVTPLITPDDKIELQILVTKDTAGEVEQNGNRAISTKRLQTTVLVNNGETIVIGGLFEETRNKSYTGIPYLSQIPFVGKMFRNKSCSIVKSELLMFITPTISANLEIV